MASVINNGGFFDIEINGMWYHGVPEFEMAEFMRQAAQQMNYAITMLPERNEEIIGLEQINEAAQRVENAAQNVEFYYNRTNVELEKITKNQKAIEKTNEEIMNGFPAVFGKPRLMDLG